MKTRTAEGYFTGLFYGFPLYVKLIRKSPLSTNYADVSFYFGEGFAPNGCQMYDIKQIIDKLFKTKSEIIPHEGVNKEIKFKYVFPYIATIRENGGMSDDIASGVAATLFHLVREHRK